MGVGAKLKSMRVGFSRVAPERKQLGVLLVVAAWIIIVIINTSPDSLGLYEIPAPYPSAPSAEASLADLASCAYWAVDVVRNSVPVVFLGGVLFWWFGIQRNGKKS